MSDDLWMADYDGLVKVLCTISHCERRWGDIQGRLAGCLAKHIFLYHNFTFGS
jgi:hypothetical protein